MRLRSRLALYALPAVALALLCSSLQDPERRTRPRVEDLQLPDLVAAIAATEGCLGVDSGRMNSGKNVIFAWFEDKEAVLRWYRGKTHRSVMQRFVRSGERRSPLKFIEDNTGPILVIASITPAEKPHFDAIDMPISQIAIELYQPLPGGTYLGARFTPAAVEVEGSRDFTKSGKTGKDG